MFPNIHVYIILQITCTIQVRSRASMGKDRLSYLTLLHMHCNLPVDLDKVVGNFARRHPHSLNLTHFLNLTLFYWSMHLFIECASYTLYSMFL